MTFQSGKSQDDIQREIDLWINLESCLKPNSIPKFYGFKKESLGFTGISFHLIFDYFPKSLQSLLENLRNKKTPYPLNFKKLQLYANSLIDSLAYLQSMKVCHRDLKPANLLLDEAEEQIYLIDLGESKEFIAFAPTQTKVDLTVAGSPKYFSPELDQAFKNNDQKVEINPFKSDVFSLGLVFLELATLEVPQKDQDLTIWEKNIKKAMRNFKKTYEPLLTDEADKKELMDFLMMMKKCLQVDPKCRPDFVRLFYRSLRYVTPESFRQHILFKEKGIDFLSNEKGDSFK